MIKRTQRATVSSRQLQRNRRARFLHAEQLEPRLAMTAEVEPNNSLAQATPFVAGSYSSNPLSGRISSEYDVDYFKTTLSQGQLFFGSYYKPDTFATELIGGLELLDEQGRLLSTMTGGAEAMTVIPKDGTYYVRTSARSDYGDFTSNYNLVAWINSYWGDTEAEPNNTSATATEAPMQRFMRGTLSSASDVDYYWFNRNSGENLTLEFAGYNEDSPTVAVYNPDGTLLARANDGRGLTAIMPTSGQYRVEVSAARDNRTVTGQYVLQMSPGWNPVYYIPPTATSFDTAAPVTIATNGTRFVGSLATPNERQYLGFDISEWGHFDSLITSIAYNQRVTLYNEAGQIISASTGGYFDVGDQPVAPGRYYVSIEALNSNATGPYMLQLDFYTPTAQRRETPLFVIDFDQQRAKYLNYAWVAPYGAPAAEDYMQGLVESRYAAWDVEVTQTIPPDRAEYVAQGIGDFGNTGAGGKTSGGAGAGVNSVQGEALTSCTMLPNWTTISYGCGTTLIHEFSHATGLGHARNVQSVLGYDNADEILPVGTQYSFPLTDSRIPTDYQNNPRDYLDWVLQAGNQTLESASNDTRATAQALSPLVDEMKYEFARVDGTSLSDDLRIVEMKLLNFNSDAWPDLVVALDGVEQIGVMLGTGPGKFASLNAYTPGFDLPAFGGYFSNVLATGDLNNDGIDDIAVAGRSSNTVAVYLANANGTLNAPAFVVAGTTPQTVEIADLNGDGKRDLITGNADGKVGVHLGNGNGAFQARQQYTANGSINDVTVARLNGDAWLDVLTANDTTSDVSMLLGTGTGALQSATNLTMEASSVAVGDFNGDGLKDIASASYGQVDVRLQSGAGQFNTLTRYFPAAGRSFAVGDLDFDGRDDLLLMGTNGMYYMPSNPDGTFPAKPIKTSSVFSKYVLVGDLNSDGRPDVLDANYNEIKPTFFKPDDLSNNKAVVLGTIATAADADYFSLVAAAGQKYVFDVEASEFQTPLDALLSVYDANGILLAQNDNARDRDTGLTSLDPYLTHTFAAAGTYYVAVTSKNGSVGSYRFKLTPGAAVDDDGPKVIGTLPAGGAAVDSRKQIFLFLNDQLDPATLTAANVQVVGSSGGLRSGSAQFDPFESVLIWTADQPLPVDAYTLTLVGGAGGVTDLKGNLLDGETDGTFVFPEISGNNTPGGNFSFQFSVNLLDATPATATVKYRQHPYNRGQFLLTFSDEVSITSAPLVARGAGPDALFNTADDRLVPLDTMQDIMTDRTLLYAYTRGIPDPDRYRIEGAVEDASGNVVPLAAEVNVTVDIPDAAFFTDAGLTQRGIVGTYVNSSLRSNATQSDWRATQTISGTRVDPGIDFDLGDFGTRQTVGVTGGSDDDWNSFSVQWDGYLQVPQADSLLKLTSQAGSRMWIDLNNDGVFASSGAEFLNNGWGTTGTTSGVFSAVIGNPGAYRIRVQFETAINESEQIHLEWLTPDLSGQVDNVGHGPSVIDTNLQPGSFTQAVGIPAVDVYFSGAIDPATLTTSNFKVRYSSDAIFYNAGDVYLADADGAIAWSPVERKATFQPALPLAGGFYLIELNGDAGGIADLRGWLLDGEFLDSYIAGNDSPFIWTDAPSGNGVAGGDYVATFNLATFAATVTATQGAVQENGAPNLTYTFTRTGDISQPGTVNFSVGGTAKFGLDYTQSGAAKFSAQAGSITFAAGMASVGLTLDPQSDALNEGDETVVLTIVSNTGVTSVASGTIQNDDPNRLHALETTTTPSGVIVTFNRALDGSPLNMYDVAGLNFGAADVTLVGASVGKIRGSVAITPNQRQLTFITTTGRLPADNYTLTLRSAANGFHDQTGSGELFDGDGNGDVGGDFVYHFTVAAEPAGAVAVVAPNFSRGPGQSVNLPASGTSGIPLSFSNGSGITAATFEVRYDPTLLNITSAAVAPGLPVGAAVNLNLTTPGVAVIRFTSPTPLAMGTTRFVDLQAAVPTTATYRSKQILDIANISLNSGTIPALDDDGLQVVAYFGDVSGNGTYTGQDASYLARLSVGIDTGLEEFALLDPFIVGDITGDGTISAQDASLLMQLAVELPVPTVPTPLPTVSFTQGGPDPKLSISQNLSAAPGDSLVIPVDIDSIVNLTGNGLASADLVIYYDPEVFEITAAALGSLVANRGWFISSHINALAGRIDLSLAGTSKLEGLFRGELAQLHATVKATARPGASAINLAATSRTRTTQLNEGFLTLIPAPTDAANDAIDGRVTIRSIATTPAITNTAQLLGEQLLITGSAASDRILVGYLPDGRIRVRVGNQHLGDFTATGVAIDAQGGDDFVYVAPAAPAAVIAAHVASHDRFFGGDNSQVVSLAIASPIIGESSSSPRLNLHAEALLQLLSAWQQEQSEMGETSLLRRTSVRRLN